MTTTERIILSQVKDLRYEKVELSNTRSVYPMFRRVNVSREIFELILAQLLKGTSAINSQISTVLSRVSLASREKPKVRLVKTGKSEY